ncbi:C2 domain-containing protein 3 isoform X2 [Frieseomelitta varia]|uniref:C2 domain-containing protein 3 isoform X2 n=1 Tax=Frieseomelitta varia TaxID=561572 RepID=UPI001CB68A60|nr:C2 domain-containing protein 3 isoform X2 [Frieseomelitta varia]
MDTKMKFEKSLPPLVEGKIHGYLKFVVDEVIWSKKNFDEIKVFASWWGETDRTEFRLADITKDVAEQKTTEIYAIRTNINLFEEYIKNCQYIELLVVSKETNTIIGTSCVTDLLEIFKCNSYFRYVPIVTNFGTKIGEIHVSMKLDYITKSLSMQFKGHKCEREQTTDNTVYSTSKNFKNQDYLLTDKCTIDEQVKPKENDPYKSILKLKRTEFHEPLNKLSNEVTGRLVAQIVTRAQRLRGNLFKETYDEDELNFTDNSINDRLRTDVCAKNEEKFHTCVLCEDIMPSNGNKTCTLKSTTLHPSLTNLVSNSLKNYRYDTKSTTNMSSSRMNSSTGDTLSEKRLCINTKDTFDLVTYIRINVESFTLSPAGYRRVKSSSLSHNDNIFLSATYFAQYDMIFQHIKETEKKESKSVRISSKKQINQVIYFNHNNMYRIPKLKHYTALQIKFKIFIRHVNKKLLIELGNAIIQINDIRTKTWKFAQHLIILNKEIKTGELNVIIELGSDFDHCERQYIDNMSIKENIPILDTPQLLNETRNKRSKNIMENQSRTSNEIPVISDRVENCSTIDNNLVTTKSISQLAESIDNKEMDIKSDKNKVLLHGLIYIIEGKELSELNTYLVCRAFWKEDKTKSQVCNDTRNPFYQFCQLVPLTYDSDLLERIKDNYLIIEVYSKNNNTDNLLGLTKLSVHQLYIAYRDPRVLPCLLLSKYPVVSIDGWVPIVDPVNGRSCGQLLALVALGTAEQIMSLKMSRYLETRSTASQFSYYTNHSQISPRMHTTNKIERESYFSNSKTQESQTDISTVKELKFNEKSQEKVLNSECSTLQNTVDLTQVLNVNKINIDQATQTEINLKEKQQSDTEQICSNELNCNSSDYSDNNSVKHNLYLPIEMYRSVGVGAEYNEGNEQLTSNHSNTTFESSAINHVENESTNSTYQSQTMFRAIVEIECALHLPKIEKINETIDPSTYVSFQASKSDHTKHINSYMITNVFPHSCNPKWNWKCDTELPTELLLHDKKRLILKIWRILDTNISMEINLEKDIVIGFSAIDLSVLISGFPMVSGWFHVMDFTGKCNGQIKVCITPLDNLSLFSKLMTSLNTTRPAYSMSQLNWVPLHVYEAHSYDIEKNKTNNTSSIVIQEEEKPVNNENQSNDSVTHIDLEDVSMSFLSLSLKQKLTELDEITKRLESRLRDVTNTAFEDDLENEFELNELSSDNENNDCKIITPILSIATKDHNSKMCHNTNTTKNEDLNALNETSNQNFFPQTCISYNNAIGSSKILNPCGKQNLSNDNSETQQSEHFVQNNRTLDNTFSDYPERGTKAHINYLLDKLSLQIPAESCLTKTIPMGKSIINLLTHLPDNNNLQNSNKCNQEHKISTLHTQMDKQIKQNLEIPVTSCATNIEINTYDKSSSMHSQISNKMSKVIREELIAEENSSTSKCDELTTYLVTSNVRHMDLNNICNPFLYQHLVPDLHHSHTPFEEETIKQLDNRYSKVFTKSISNRLNRIHSSIETNLSLENAEHFRTTPSGVSENILSVLHNTNYNDVLASNSTESTTTISLDNSMIKSIDSEIVENSDSISSKTSVLVFSRQAPDGGNPIEDNKKPLIIQQEDEILHL